MLQFGNWSTRSNQETDQSDHHCGSAQTAANVHGVRPACDRPAFAVLVDGAQRVTVPGVRFIDEVPSVEGRVVPRTMWSW